MFKWKMFFLCRKSALQNIMKNCPSILRVKKSQNMLQNLWVWFLSVLKFYFKYASSSCFCWFKILKKKLLYLCFCCFYMKLVLVQLLVPFLQNFTGAYICSPPPIFVTCHHFLVCVDQNGYYFIVYMFCFINLTALSYFCLK